MTETVIPTNYQTTKNSHQTLPRSILISRSADFTLLPHRFALEVRGFEPLTFSLRTRRSTN